MKITPAHDANDFEVGTRHKLADAGRSIARDGNDGERHRRRGRVSRRAARASIASRRASASCRCSKHLERAREDRAAHTRRASLLSLRHGRRAAAVGSVVREHGAARRAGACRRCATAQFAFFPSDGKPCTSTGSTNIRDWNISRQLWWGHRIPVWYCDDAMLRTIIVSRDDVTECPKCGGPVRQDEDVLDTWFSSWLWPFSTLGWPDKSRPTSRRSIRLTISSPLRRFCSSGSRA